MGHGQGHQHSPTFTNIFACEFWWPDDEPSQSKIPDNPSTTNQANTNPTTTNQTTALVSTTNGEVQENEDILKSTIPQSVAKSTDSDDFFMIAIVGGLIFWRWKCRQKVARDISNMDIKTNEIEEKNVVNDIDQEDPPKISNNYIE